MQVYLHSPVISHFGKHSGSVLELSLNTAKKSLQGFGKEGIEFLIFASFCPEIYTGEFHIPGRIATELGLTDIFCIRSETASSSGASAFHLAHHLIQSGRFHSGLVIATEIMSRLPRNENNVLLGSVLSDSQRQLGMSMAQGGALVAQRYLHKYSYTRRDLYSLAEKLHQNGCSNPKAHIKKSIDWETYQSAPLFADPLGLYDISPLSDGSVAMVLSRKPGLSSVVGLGQGLAKMDASVEDCSFPASVIAFQKAYAEAKIGPRDIDIAELHDAFTIFEVIGMEDSGLCPRGEGLGWIRRGDTHPGSKLPINASGGLKTRGHPIAASGLAQIAELDRFFESDKGLRHGLAHSIGGLATNNFATILRNERT